MTVMGRGVAAISIAAGAAGYFLHWRSLLIVGVAGLLAVAYGFITTRSSQSIEVQRSLHPKKVTKGSASIALLSMKNTAVASSGRIHVVQALGGDELVATLPPLLGKQSAVKSVPLPTTRRGHFIVGPVTIRRGDIFGLFRREQTFGASEELWVQPAVAAFRPLSMGFQRDIEGPTSDRAPVGNMAFHRIREYVPGDDPRLIHWKATARRSTDVLELMVRHNVDTTQPATVVLLDVASERFVDDQFEVAVDVAASTTHAALTIGGNLKITTTAGDEVVLPAGVARNDAPVLDFLTDVETTTSGTLLETMSELALSPGGTTLIMVTGHPTEDEVSRAAALTKRFARVLLVAVTDDEVANPFPQLAVVFGSSLENVTRQWNREMVS